MKETTRKTVAGALVAAVGLAVALALLVPRAAHSQPNPQTSPFTYATIITPGAPTLTAPGKGVWSNSIVPQSSATAFNGQSNRTLIDLRGSECANGKPSVSLQFQGQVTASTATTNISIAFAASHDKLTNGFFGVETNAQFFWTWTIPTAATANPQLVTAVTNINFDKVGPTPYIYVQSLWLGYNDGYLTNWTLKASVR